MLALSLGLRSTNFWLTVHFLYRGGIALIGIHQDFRNTVFCFFKHFLFSRYKSLVRITGIFSITNFLTRADNNFFKSVCQIRSFAINSSPCSRKILTMRSSAFDIMI